MPRFRVYAIMTASKSLGVFEAETAEEAEAMAAETGDDYVNICHQCSSEVDVGDVYKYETEHED